MININSLFYRNKIQSSPRKREFRPRRHAEPLENSIHAMKTIRNAKKQEQKARMFSRDHVQPVGELRFPGFSSLTSFVFKAGKERGI